MIFWIYIIVLVAIYNLNIWNRKNMYGLITDTPTIILTFKFIPLFSNFQSFNNPHKIYALAKKKKQKEHFFQNKLAGLTQWFPISIRTVNIFDFFQSIVVSPEHAKNVRKKSYKPRKFVRLLSDYPVKRWILNVISGL